MAQKTMEQLLETSTSRNGSHAGVSAPPATELSGQGRVEEAPEPAFDFFDVVLIFARHKWVIVFWMLFGILCGLYFLYQQPVLYSANAVIMPPQGETGSSAILGQFGALAGLGSGSISNRSDLYLGLLRSRTTGYDMVDRFHLDQVYRLPKDIAALVLLFKRSSFGASKDSFITISVEDDKPERAAALANGFVDELYALNNKLAIGEAGQRRRFFEQQLAAEKDKLADAEVALKNIQLSTGVVQLSGQTETVIRAVAQVQADITSHEVQLAALRSSATSENPEVVRLRTELAGLREQLQNLQKGKSSNGDAMSAAQLPSVSLEYVRKAREVQYHQTLFDLLARQLEGARIDEAKASPTIQVIDTAVVPKFPSWPSRNLFLGIGGFIGLVLGCLRCAIIFLYDYVDEDPRFHDKFVALKRAFYLAR